MKKKKTIKKDEVIVEEVKPKLVKESPRAKYAFQEMQARPWDGSMNNLEVYSTRSNEETLRFIEKGLTTHNILVNASPPGTGKSWLLTQLVKRRKDLEVIHISQTPGSVSIPEIQKWERSTVRNTGFIELNQKDCLGNSVLKPDRGIKPTEGNCRFTGMLDHLHKKTGIDSYQTWEFCSKNCPMFERCKVSSGPGYGYLHERKQDQDKQYLRSHELGLPNEVDTKLIFIDELAKLSLQKTFEIKWNSIQALLETAGEENVIVVLDLFKQFKKEAEDKPQTARYGIDALRFIEIASETLPTTDSEDWSHILKHVMQADHKVAEQQTKLIKIKQAKLDLETELPTRHTWFFYLLQEVLRYRNNTKPEACFQLDRKQEKLTVTLLNTRLIEKLNTAPHIIVNDATADIADIQAFSNHLGFRPYTVVREIAPATNHVKTDYLQVSRKMNTGNSRNEANQVEINQLLKELSYRFDPSETGIIDFKRFEDHYKHYPVFLNHLGAARGSNAAQDLKNLIVIGTPKEHRGSLLTRFMLNHVQTYQQINEIDTEAFYFKELTKEIVQEIHRLRAHRREKETLKVIFISKEDYSWLSQDIEQLTFDNIECLGYGFEQILTKEDLDTIDRILTEELQKIKYLAEDWSAVLRDKQNVLWGHHVVELTKYLTQYLHEISVRIQIVLLNSNLSMQANKPLNTLLNNVSKQIKMLPRYKQLEDILDAFSVLIGEPNVPRLSF